MSFVLRVRVVLPELLFRLFGLPVDEDRGFKWAISQALVALRVAKGLRCRNTAFLDRAEEVVAEFLDAFLGFASAHLMAALLWPQWVKSG